MLRSPRRLATAIFLAALAIRVVFVLQYRANPLFDRPIIDARTYHESALRLARGEGFAPGVFTRAPLYPLFLAGIYAPAGAGGAESGAPPADAARAAESRAILAAKLAQALVGALSALFLTLAGARLLGLLEGGIAGALFALHPVLVFYTGELFVETLAIALTLGALLALAAGLDPRGRAAPRPAAFLLAGALLGLSIVARPTSLFVAAPLPFLIVLALRRRAGLLRAAAGGALPFALGAALVVAPVTLRNHREGGGWVLVSAQGGVNLWIANNPDADGRSALSPGRGRSATASPSADIIDAASREIAEAEEGRPLTPGEVSDFWGRRAKRWMRERPLDFARLTLSKLGDFWSGGEIWDQQCDVDFLSRFSPLLDALLVARPVALPGGVVMPLAALGFLAALAAWRRTWLLLAFFLPYLAGVLLFVMTSRYRLPLLPFLFLFAGSGAALLGRRLRQGRASALAGPAALLLLFGIAANLHPRRTNPILAARGRVFVANAWIEAGRPDSALPYLDEASRIAPGAADPYYARGLARLAVDDDAGARAAFAAALERDPGFERAAANLGNLHAVAGEWDEAVRLYEQALDAAPGDSLLAENLAAIGSEAGRAGRPDVAERAFRRVLAVRPGDAGVLNALAWNLAERLGRPREAVPLAEAALAASPGAPEVEDTLGWSLLLAGDVGRAVPHLRAARAALPADPDVALHLGVALASGPGPAERAESHALLDEAARAPGGDARAARARALLER